MHVRYNNSTTPRQLATQLTKLRWTYLAEQNVVAQAHELDPSLLGDVRDTVFDPHVPALHLCTQP